MSHNKTRRARVDADGTARPLTRIVAHISGGVINFPGNVKDYELRDTDPHEDAPRIGPANRRERRAARNK